MDDVVILPAATGERYAIAGAQWTWKVRPKETKGSFCFFEMTVEPGQGVPLHVHSYTEAFYILDGELEFQSADIRRAPTRCGQGDVVVAHHGVLHSFFNRSDRDARLLSISTAAHEPFFDAIVAEDRATPFSAMTPAQAFARIAEIGARTDCRFAEVPQDNV
jgi:quercetin dioxygenase-like cupin family protein